MSEKDTSKVKKEMWQRKIRECFMEEVTFAQALMAPTPVLLPGKPHGRGSLVHCSPWGR